MLKLKLLWQNLMNYQQHTMKWLGVIIVNDGKNQWMPKENPWLLTKQETRRTTTEKVYLTKSMDFSYKNQL